MKQKLESIGEFDLSVFDGRYSEVVQRLKEYFSEYALVKNKVKLELYWIKFCLENLKMSGELENFDMKKVDDIIKIYDKFSYDSYVKIKKAELKIGNQLQAIESFIEAELKKIKLKDVIGLVSMECGIENINDVAYALMMSTGIKQAWIPTAEDLIEEIDEVHIGEDIYMLSRDERFGEVSTTLERELLIYQRRWSSILQRLDSVKIGPTATALLDKNSPALSKKFINECLGLYLIEENLNKDYTEQIYDCIKKFNSVLLEFNSDMKGAEHFSFKENASYESSANDITVSNMFFISQYNKVNASQRARELTDFYSQQNVVLGFGYSLQAIERTISEIRNLSDY